jgi:diacylglycerol kinase (ATP)
VCDALATRGIEVCVTLDATAGVEAARRAFATGHGVLACGGDGTVSVLAGLAASAGGALGVVPIGAGNDFARHFGIDPRRPLAALDLLETGRIVAIDLGRASTADGTTRWFTTVANVGFDAEANRWANGVHWASGTTLYVLAVLRTLVTYHPRVLDLTVDGSSWHGAAWLVAVGNTRFYAGGMMITPDASAEDGRLDVCVVGRVSRAALLLRFPRVFRGTHRDVVGVEAMRGRVVDLDAAGGDLVLYASGERVGPLPAHVECVAGALRMLVPGTIPAGVATAR